MKKNILHKVIHALLLLASVVILDACKDELEGSMYRTNDMQMLDEYIYESGNGLTEFGRILKKSEYAGMLHAYGVYTCFAPTDNAVKEYMSSTGRTIDGLTTEEATEIIGYHVVVGSTTSVEFVNGRLGSTNLVNFYLTTNIRTDEQSNVWYEIDRKAKVVEADIEVGNGFIHIVDGMLAKPTQSLQDMIEELPDDEFSFIKSLFRRTDIYYSSLGSDLDNFYTVFLHNNRSFHDDEIYDEDDLLALLRENTPEVTDDDELIENFIKYHVGEGRRYIADMYYMSAINTLATGYVLTVQTKKNEIKLNEFKTGGRYDEDGIPVLTDSDYTDFTCANGLTQEVSGVLQIINRLAYRVDFYLTEQPEFMALPDYRSAPLSSGSRSFATGQIANIYWPSKSNSLVYQSRDLSTGNFDRQNQQIYGDMIEIRVRTSTNRYIEFQLPTLMEGDYNVWLCYRSTANSSTGNSNLKFNMTFVEEEQEDQTFGTFEIHRMPLIYASGSTTLLDHEAMVKSGWKQYTAREAHVYMASRNLGTIQVKSTGSHIIRFDATNDAGSNITWDMIQFIPVDDDQVWPMIDMMGDYIYEDTPSSEIFPYN